jgi:hypothetical protein
MTLYCAIFTSPWATNIDESFASESFEETLSFILKRAEGRGYKEANIVRVNDDGLEEVIVCMRTLK